MRARRRPTAGPTPARGPDRDRPGTTGRRSRRRRIGLFGLLGVLILCPLVIVAAIGGVTICNPRLNAVSDAYAPQPGRTAEWAAAGSTAYSDDAIERLSRTNTIVLIPKFAANYDIQKQFQQVRQLVADGKRSGNDVRVFLYFNASFWFDQNQDGWAPFSSSFKDSYFLQDSRGDAVPYYGVGNTEGDGDGVVGHVLDLASPSYREWAVKTVKAWMTQAPAAGVVLDSANPFVGESPVRRALSTGTVTPNELLCGAAPSRDENGNCERVADWNNGLTTLMSSLTSALAPTGQKVLYNGVAPSDLRPARNVALLDHAAGASNEAFCFASSLDGAKVTPTDLSSDLNMMGKAAEDGKTLLQIVNFQRPENLKYGPYCLGTFLIGWQPGSSYLIFHKNYRTLADQPAFPELDLDLGAPQGQYSSENGVLVRAFAKGTVAVNPTSSPKRFTVPRSGVQMKDGRVSAPLSKGSVVTVDARSAVFVADDATLTTSSGGPALCRTVG